MSQHLHRFLLFASALAGVAAGAGAEDAVTLQLNELEYLEMPGLNVMLAHDYYPDGHQGGVGIIQNGQRVATNGDLRLDRTPGQWQPVPRKAGERVIDRATNSIAVRMAYPDSAKNRTGFNPIDYPDLEFAYTVRVTPSLADGPGAFHIVVDLDEPLPEAWIGRVGFNLELFPGLLFGRSWSMDGRVGIFPRQANGPGTIDADGAYQIEALAKGRRLTIAPESDAQRMSIEDVLGGGLELIDGRGQHDNGWFVVRSLVAKGATTRAVDWLVRPHPIPGFVSTPVVQVSQVGYHPSQPKIAVIELDPRDTRRPTAVLERIHGDGTRETVLQAVPNEWGRFLRYTDLQLDFSTVTTPGMYVVRYGDVASQPFRIATDVYERHVWQPTLEYFLPVQMCHMRVNDRYRTWHGVCHLDDATMAPVNHVHFDGYAQGPTTLCGFQPGQHVPGLDRGGWHDAGDDDLRIESQADTVLGLVLVWEAFGVDYDNTTIDQANRVVEIHRPDGRPDILQQVEHGVLTILGSHRALGRFYRGMITPTLRQYTLLGDPANATDNEVFAPARDELAAVPPIGSGRTGAPDDRWVFTEDNPRHEMQAVAALAAAARVLRGYDDALADECLRVATEVWDERHDAAGGFGVPAAVELLLATDDQRYADFIVANQAGIAQFFRYVGWTVVRALPQIKDDAFRHAVAAAARAHAETVAAQSRATPYGVPYEPDIWGAGWGIQRFGMQQYYLHAAYPDLYSRDPMLRALDFILGCHPGANSASFVSGVGARSVTVAYGFNRADWSFIPGGSVSGTALIRPDFPELVEWPYLWQQTEYVLGDGTTDYLFLVLAAGHLLNES